MMASRTRMRPEWIVVESVTLVHPLVSMESLISLMDGKRLVSIAVALVKKKASSAVRTSAGT
jgi:hypothetical protein